MLEFGLLLVPAAIIPFAVVKIELSKAKRRNREVMRHLRTMDIVGVAPQAGKQWGPE